MKRYILIPLVFAVVSIALTLSSDAQVFTNNESQEPAYLFVLSGTSGKMEDDTLTINGMPNVVYFSDRPSRIAGHKSVADFVELWNKSSDSFKADPPNATLSIMDGDSAKNVVVELKSVETKDDSVTFKVRVLQGEAPKTFSNSSLFIDEFHFGPNPGDG